MNLFPETRMLAEAKHSGRRAHRLVIELLIFLLLFTISSTIESVIITPAMTAAVLTSPAFSEITQNGAAVLAEEGIAAYVSYLGDAVIEIMNTLPDWVMALQLYATVAVIVTVLIYCTKIEKRPLSSLGLHKRGAALEYLAGAGIGFVLLSLAVLFCVVTGKLSLSVSDLTAGKIVWIIIFFLGFVVQGASEELLCRGYLMVSLSRGCPVWTAIASNALLFAALHLANPGISVVAFINLALFGVFASIYTLRRGSLWGICAIHSVWNFVQGNVFGILVSGSPLGPSFLRAQAAEGSAAELITGGAFGLEGGIGVTVVLAAAIGVLLMIPTKKSELAPAGDKPGEAANADTVH